MKKVIIFTLLGIALFAVSVFSAYYYLSSLEQTNNLFLLAVALISISAGTYCMIRANSTNPTVETEKGQAVTPSEEGLKKMIQRNNELSTQWNKTVEQKDKLQMLEMAAAAEEQEKKQAGI